MIELIHDTPPPRLLENRRLIDAPIGPVNPRNAWNNFATKGKQDIHKQLMPLQRGLCVYCEAIQNFIDLEFEIVNNQYLFPFLSAREEHYNIFKN